jgi:hypothetical protein
MDTRAAQKNIEIQPYRRDIAYAPRYGPENRRESMPKKTATKPGMVTLISISHNQDVKNF